MNFFVTFHHFPPKNAGRKKLVSSVLIIRVSLAPRAGEGTPNHNLIDKNSSCVPGVFSQDIASMRSQDSKTGEEKTRGIKLTRGGPLYKVGKWREMNFCGLVFVFWSRLKP